MIAFDFWREVNEVKKHNAPSRERVEQLKRQHAGRTGGTPISAVEWLKKGGTI